MISYPPHGQALAVVISSAVRVRTPFCLDADGRVLVVGGDAGRLYRVRWAFVLESVDDASRRLLTCASGDYERIALPLRLRLFGHPVRFAVPRKQLFNVRRRVEVAAG